MIHCVVNIECQRCHEAWSIEVVFSKAYGPGAFGIEKSLADHECNE